MPVSSTHMHIDDVSRSMEEWLRGAVPGVEVAFVSQFQEVDAEGVVSAADTTQRVEVCFQGIAPEKADRALLNREDVFLLAYLLRVTGADALEAQRIYSEIYFRAHRSDDFKVGALPGAPGTVRNPAGAPATLSITARLVQPVEAEIPGIVTYPLKLKLRALGRIAGKIVSEAGSPIMHAQIEARALDKRVTSDAAGRFVIPGAPAAGTVSLTVNARNRSVDVSVNIEEQAEVVIVLPKENEHA